MEHPPHNENAPLDLEKEVYAGLSATWFKTVQEILPGHLRDLPKAKLTEEELQLYNDAYTVLGNMVKEKNVEVSFREEETPVSGDGTSHTTLRRPQFKLKTERGKKEDTPRQIHTPSTDTPT